MKSIPDSFAIELKRKGPGKLVFFEIDGGSVVFGNDVDCFDFGTGGFCSVHPVTEMRMIGIRMKF